MGVDRARFVDNVPKKFKCDNCNLVLFDPVKTDLDNVVCRECFKVTEQTWASELTELDDHTMLKELNQMKVKCRFCTKVGELEHLFTHEAKCQFNPQVNPVAEKLDTVSKQNEVLYNENAQLNKKLEEKQQELVEKEMMHSSRLEHHRIERDRMAMEKEKVEQSLRDIRNECDELVKKAQGLDTDLWKFSFENKDQTETIERLKEELSIVKRESKPSEKRSLSVYNGEPKHSDYCSGKKKKTDPTKSEIMYKTQVDNLHSEISNLSNEICKLREEHQQQQTEIRKLNEHFEQMQASFFESQESLEEEKREARKKIKQLEKYRDKALDDVDKLKDVRKPLPVTRKLLNAKVITRTTYDTMIHVPLYQFHHFKLTHDHITEALRVGRILDVLLCKVKPGMRVLFLADDPYVAACLAFRAQRRQRTTDEDGGIITVGPKPSECRQCTPKILSYLEVQKQLMRIGTTDELCEEDMETYDLIIRDANDEATAKLLCDEQIAKSKLITVSMTCDELDFGSQSFYSTYFGEVSKCKHCD